MMMMMPELLMVISSYLWPAIELLFDSFSLCAQPPNPRPAVPLSGEGELKVPARCSFSSGVP